MMKKYLSVLLFSLMLIVLARPAMADLTPDQEKRIREAAPEKATAEPKKPRKVLIWNTPYMDKSPHKGYTIPQSACALKVLGEKTGAYASVTSDDQTLLLPENLKQFDAILLNNSCGAMTTPTDDAMEKFKSLGYDGSREEITELLRKSLLQWVEAGHGVFAFHYSAGGERDWPGYAELLGGRVNGHPWNQEIGVTVEEPSHPLVKSLPKPKFRIADEVFQYREPYDRTKVRVLLSVDKEVTDMTVPWLHRDDNDFALCWVKSYGKGRVFYGEFGHRTELWWNPMLLTFYLDAIQFVCGDIDAPMEPRKE